MTNALTKHENTIIKLVRAVTLLDSTQVFPHRNFRQQRPPKTPFVTVDFSSDDESIGEDGLIYYEEDGLLKEKTVGERRSTFSLRFYGRDAHQFATLVNAVKRSQRVVKILRENKIGGLREVGSLQSLSAVVGTEIEPMWRRDYSFTFRFEAILDEPRPHMDDFQIDVTLQRYPDAPDARTVTFTSED